MSALGIFLLTYYADTRMFYAEPPPPIRRAPTPPTAQPPEEDLPPSSHVNYALVSYFLVF